MNTIPLTDKTTAHSIIDQIKEESNKFHGLSAEISKAIVGQYDTIEFLIIAIISNGHILLEGVPGVAKTTMIKAVAQALGLSFKRIQFTPDLLPADLIGTSIFNVKTQEFETKKGPVFAHLILADEINRSPAKVQSALLEAMQEHQVTIGSHTFFLEEPFLVFATQNPIEQEGTYRLPEAQLDRFMFKLLVNYPTQTQEREIIKRITYSDNVHQVLTKSDVLAAHRLVQSIYVDDKIIEYILNIVFATRGSSAHVLGNYASYLSYGASPRATIALYQASKARAFLKQRHFVIPDDVKALAPAILRHRIGLSYEAEMAHVTHDCVIRKIIEAIPAP